MRLIPLEIGRLESSLRIITGSENTVILPIPSWLIEHPDGLVLFDTGLHPELRHSTDRIGTSANHFVPHFPEGEELSARLDRRGIRTSDITHMVFSHLHFDHAGGTAEIPNARIVVQQAEWDAGHNQKLIDHDVYNPDDFDLGHDVQGLEGEFDLFGDGRIICLPTPGHTIGHQALRVELESGSRVLTGDCIYFQAMLDQMAVPAFGYDTNMQRRSMEELRRLRDEEGCQLLFGHDREQFAALPAHGLT